MKEHPILFSTEMVQAILAGRKMQTRRVIKPQPHHDGGKTDSVLWQCKQVDQFGQRRMMPYHGNPALITKWCPYGQPGDRLWVKETFIDWECACVAAFDRAIMGCQSCGGKGYGVAYKASGHESSYWKPSIFMSRKLSRLTLEVLNVRVQRVQEITEEDAVEEGLSVQSDSLCGCQSKARTRFEMLWDSINAKREGCSWADNPWVWAITFKRL